MDLAGERCVLSDGTTNGLKNRIMGYKFNLALLMGCCCRCPRFQSFVLLVASAPEWVEKKVCMKVNFSVRLPVRLKVEALEIGGIYPE